MARTTETKLSRRERQIMDILFELGEATAEEVRVRLPDPPSSSAARAMLGKLEAKGQARHIERDLRFVYSPAVSRSRARKSAVSRLIRVFYDGSVAQAVDGMLDQQGARLSDEELDRLADAVAQARRRRKGS